MFFSLLFLIIFVFIYFLPPEREQYFHDLFEEEAGRGRAHEEEEEEEEEPGEELAEVNFVVKANMWGSVVALTDSLEKMLKPHKDEVKNTYFIKIFFKCNMKKKNH